MKILLVNKFLYPNGGSETYLFKLGEVLRKNGCEVQYFGMEHEGRCVGNAVDAYTSDMDFHNGGGAAKLVYPLKTIYSKEARKKIRLVLDDFQPDAVHLNNFNYQLTPSIILEIRKWEKQTGHPVRIVFTAHDYQLICPNHMMRNPQTGRNCEKCAGGNFIRCAQGKCIHGSFAKSLIGAAEGYFWKAKGVYRQLDAILCPSKFIKTKLDTNRVLAPKTMVLRNFVEPVRRERTEKQPFALYFGRFSEEKGIKTLISVCRELPDIPFVFAGGGPLEEEIRRVPNVRCAGFQEGEALKKLIGEARFSVYPSEWYENCPLSVMESQMYGTPVLGADIGGIPELIRPGKTGELFESGNKEELKKKILDLWNASEAEIGAYSGQCRAAEFDSPQRYYESILPIYQGQEKRKS